MALGQPENKYYIWGGGGHGKVVLDILYAAFGADSVIGIFDDNLNKTGSIFYGSIILGSIETFDNPVYNLVIAIGDNVTRMKKSKLFQQKILNFSKAIHPSAEIAPTVKIGDGTVVMPNAVINADAEIGRHAIINSGVIIEHDCQIGDFSHIAPGAILTGNVTVGELSFIGANSTIIPGINIGKNCVIGAGSVVIRDLPDNVTAYGVPARINTKRAIHE